MSKKAVLTTFIIAIVLIAIVGALSFYMAKNRPSADITALPVPPVPSGAPAGYPPVPPSLRLKGDVNNDGIVNVLDIGIIVSSWQLIDATHNLVDGVNGQANLINVLDLSQVITYWGCTEQKSGCGYYNFVTPTPTPTGTAIVPPPIPTLPPTSSVTATATATAIATKTATASATTSPTQDYVIKLGETKAIGNYPFSILYYSGGTSGYFYTYFVANNNTNSQEKCLSKIQIFYNNNYFMFYSCVAAQYTVKLDPRKSNANQITVTVLKVSAGAPSATPTLTPAVTATPCSWYNRLRRRC